MAEMGEYTSLAYIACGLLVAIYASDRFNTPPSNRSSTRRALYWSSCVGYVVSALVVFAALSVLLKVAAFQTLLTGAAGAPPLPEDIAALPAPLIATLAMTTLMPTFPGLKRLDAWILATFHDWGAIPAEVKRRARMLTPHGFAVTDADVAALREAYSEDGGLTPHLRATRGEGLALSQHRLTRVAKLYQAIGTLAEDKRYARYFTRNDEEFVRLQVETETFIAQSAAALTLAAKVNAAEAEAAFGDLMRERRELFKSACQGVFIRLAEFLARAVLQSEPTEKDIVARLKRIGFADCKPMNQPEFPINGLTLLAVFVLLYLAVVSIFFSHLRNLPDMSEPLLAMTFKVALVRLVTAGMVVWLLQRFAFFRRDPGEPPQYFAYVLCGLIGAGLSAALCAPFVLGYYADPLAGAWAQLPLVVLSGILCMVLALCCNDWPGDEAPPAWLRPAEALGCAGAVLVGTSIMHFGGMLSGQLAALEGWMAAAFITLPSTLALVIGGLVPHLYRSARRAAAARRAESAQPGAVEPDEPRRLPPPLAVGASAAASAG